MTRIARLAALSVLILGFIPGAQAAPILFTAFLDGPSEDPPVPSPGTGFALVTFDIVAHTMRVEVTFSDLVGPTTVAHIHSPTAVPAEGTAGVATTTPTFPGFPAGVTSGSYDVTFDMTMASSYNPAYLTMHGGVIADAELALFESMLERTAYLNIHSTFRPSGEIRGFLIAQIAEPGGIGLLMIGVAGLLLRRRRSPV